MDKDYRDKKKLSKSQDIFPDNRDKRIPKQPVASIFIRSAVSPVDSKETVKHLFRPILSRPWSSGTTIR